MGSPCSCEVQLSLVLDLTMWPPPVVTSHGSVKRQGSPGTRPPASPWQPHARSRLTHLSPLSQSSESLYALSMHFICLFPNVFYFILILLSFFLYSSAIAVPLYRGQHGRERIFCVKYVFVFITSILSFLRASCLPSLPFLVYHPLHSLPPSFLLSPCFF